MALVVRYQRVGSRLAPTARDHATHLRGLRTISRRELNSDDWNRDAGSGAKESLGRRFQVQRIWRARSPPE